MKNIVLSIIFTLIGTTILFGQSLSLQWDGEQIADGETVYIYGELSDDQFAEYLANVQVKNNTDRDIAVKAKREDIQVVEGSYNYLCWVTCFQPDILISPDAYTIPAGALTPEETFGGHYGPQGNAGTTIIKYTFFKDGDETDAVSFIVQFVVTPSSVEDILARSSFSNAYPNPANGQTFLDYSFPQEVKSASLTLFNMLGQAVKTVELNNNTGRAVVALNDLNEGVYFYSLFINNELAQTKKLVVRK